MLIMIKKYLRIWNIVKGVTKAKNKLNLEIRLFGMMIGSLLTNETDVDNDQEVFEDLEHSQGGNESQKQVKFGNQVVWDDDWLEGDEEVSRQPRKQSQRSVSKKPKKQGQNSENPYQTFDDDVEDDDDLFSSVRANDIQKNRGQKGFEQKMGNGRRRETSRQQPVFLDGASNGRRRKNNQYQEEEEDDFLEQQISSRQSQLQQKSKKLKESQKDFQRWTPRGKSKVRAEGDEWDEDNSDGNLRRTVARKSKVVKSQKSQGSSVPKEESASRLKKKTVKKSGGGLDIVTGLPL
eukprot:TRINITY_DN2238_c0_g1_i4.p3 TRINITY_DN2238_c0_g1~~TRINITY_DN2238_c0_g1_i4.p3  ORF type:complete len:292 (-),score=64.29 TRINITY_DN2238_c0_g1_i4:377-1252(-)